MLGLLALFSALGASSIMTAFEDTSADEPEPDNIDPPEMTDGQNLLDDSEGDNLLLLAQDAAAGWEEPVAAEDAPDLHTPAAATAFPETGEDWAAPMAPPLESATDTVFNLPVGSVLDGMPQSDDIPDLPDLPLDLSGGETVDYLYGGGAADLLSGGGGDDALMGRAGDDRLDGGAGNDQLDGGDGRDELKGGTGADSLSGGAGMDSLFGGRGTDYLSGGDGDDLLNGGFGADSLIGGAGADRLNGGSGDDWLSGGTGSDVLSGGTGRDVLDGGTGNDTLSGLDGGRDDNAADFLNGGDGADVLTLGMGDQATGGTGADRFQMIEGEGDVSRILDFEIGNDELHVIYRDTGDGPPDLRLSLDEATGEVTILLDNQPFAVVSNAAGLTPEMITLRSA